MNEQVERLKALTREQRELIKKLLVENQRLNTLTQTLHNQNHDLDLEPQ
jgi:hypothetical protein